MTHCSYILLTALPTTWIVVGGVLILAALSAIAIALFKTYEVGLLKKEVEELRETIRMMRYEETNLSRMLHTADKTVEMTDRTIPQESLPEENDFPERLEEKQSVIQDDSLENESIPELIKANTLHQEFDIVLTKDIEGATITVPQEEITQITEDTSNPKTEEIEKGEDISLEKHPSYFAEVQEKKQSPQHKQAINERRPAIPNDLFSAWFEENEQLEYSETETVEEASLQSQDKVVATPQEETIISEKTIQLVHSDNDVIENESPQTTEIQIAETKETPDNFTINDTPLKKEDERFLRKLERIVNTRMRNPNLNIDIIASQFGMGRTNFYRKVRELTGISPNDYLRKSRMEYAANILCTTDIPINDVCVQVGISDAQYFSRVFKMFFGVTPSVYREMHQQTNNNNTNL